MCGNTRHPLFCFPLHVPLSCTYSGVIYNTPMLYINPHGVVSMYIVSISFNNERKQKWATDSTTGIYVFLAQWGRVAHICISKLTIIGSDNGLSPGRREAIIWINAGLLLIRTLGTNFSEILSEIHTFSFKKMHLKMSSAKLRQFCLDLNVLRHCHSYYI